MIISKGAKDMMFRMDSLRAITQKRDKRDVQESYEDSLDRINEDLDENDE